MSGSFSSLHLDPDAAALLAAMRSAGLPRIEMLTPERARAQLAELRARAKIVPPPIAEAEDLAAPGRAGPIPLRIYRPTAAPGPLPGFVFFHGGGFVLGNLSTHDVLCRILANASGSAVVAVDYRLAPEHPFPAALEDALDAVRWIEGNAAALRIRRGPLVIGGDSAGGNLAAVAALTARDGGLPPIALQVLVYPVLDLTLGHASQALDAEGLPLSGPAMRWFRDHYLGAAGDPQDWRASPLRASSLAGAAPCYLITAGADPLRDEGLAYAAQLAQEGVALTHCHFPGQMHGMLTAGIGTPTARQALAGIGAAVRQAAATS